MLHCNALLVFIRFTTSRLFEVRELHNSGGLFDIKKDRGSILGFLYFHGELEYICVCVCMCVYVCIRTHTHTLHVGYSDVSPLADIRMQHLESPNSFKLAETLHTSSAKAVYV